MPTLTANTGHAILSLSLTNTNYRYSYSKLPPIPLLPSVMPVVCPLAGWSPLVDVYHGRARSRSGTVQGVDTPIKQQFALRFSSPKDFWSTLQNSCRYYGNFIPYTRRKGRVVVVVGCAGYASTRWPDVGLNDVISLDARLDAQYLFPTVTVVVCQRCRVQRCLSIRETGRETWNDGEKGENQILSSLRSLFKTLSSRYTALVPHKYLFPPSLSFHRFPLA